MREQLLNEVREIIHAFPQASEKNSYGGSICFSIVKNKTICYFHDNYQGSGRVVLWCPAYPDLKKELLQNKPTHYFQPVASANGHFSEWLGIYLDTTGEDSVNWNAVSKILEDAFLKIASKKQIGKWKQTPR